MKMKSLMIYLFICLVGNSAFPDDGVVTGIVNDNRVRIRQEPNLEGKHLDFLYKGEKVSIWGRSKEKMKIDNMNAYWYKIKSKSGIVGWSYGYFIDTDEQKLAAIFPSSTVNFDNFHIVKDGISSHAIFNCTFSYGSYLFATSEHSQFFDTYEEGLYIFDINDPVNPQLMKRVDIPGGGAYEVMVSGTSDGRQYAYLACGKRGLYIIDVSNPSAAAIVKTVGSPVYARGGGSGIMVSGTSDGRQYAYVAGGESGLHIIDVTNPLSAYFVKTVKTPGDVLGVFVSGNYAYVPGGPNGLHIIDITNPASASMVKTVDTQSYNCGVSVFTMADGHSYALLAGTSDGSRKCNLCILDVTHPLTSTIIQTIDFEYYALSITVCPDGKMPDGHHYVFFVTYDSFFLDDMSPEVIIIVIYIIDITNPTSPVIIKTFETQGWRSEWNEIWPSKVYLVEMADGHYYAYMAAGPRGLIIISE